MLSMSQRQFENFTASSLYCEKCKTAMPVRERLLLVLPDKEIFDYLCTGCGSSVGRREITGGEKLVAEDKARRRRRRAATPPHIPPQPACASVFSALAKLVGRRWKPW